MAKRCSHSRRSHSRKMRGGSASEYGTALYGAAGQQHAAHGNMIAMNQVGGGVKYVKFTDGDKTYVKKEDSSYELQKGEEETDEDAFTEFNKPDLKGGRKSNMNFMMVPKMFMRMTRSRKHRRASKRHHGKSRKHKK